MRKILYLFNLFWSHIEKDFFEITEGTKLDFLKRFCYSGRPHTAKIHTLLKALGLKRHPVEDAQ